MANQAVYVTVRGRLDWAKVTGAARPHTGEKKYDKGPSWSLDITPDIESKKKLAAAGIDATSRKYRTPKGKDTRKEKFLSLRHLENRSDGKKNKSPEIVTINGKPWDDNVEIGNGSIADVLIKVVDYGSASDKGTYLQKIRVLKLVEYDGGGDFEPIDEDDEFAGEVANEPQFDTPAEYTAEPEPAEENTPEPTSEPNPDALDDEIPFN